MPLGDDTADLRALVARDGRALRDVATLLTGDAALAREVVLEACVVAATRAPDGTADDAFVRREVLALARRQRPGWATPSPAEPPDGDRQGDEPAGAPPSVATLLARLPEREREALVLRCVHELDDADVAAALDVPVRTARAWADWAQSDVVGLLPVATAADACATLRASAPGRAGPAWDDIEERVGQRRARRRSARTAVAAGVAALVLVIVVALASGVSRGDGRRLRDAAPGPAFVPTTPTAADGETPDMAMPYGLEGVWPLSSQADLDLHLSTASTAYDEPAPTAEAFLREYVGMPRAVVSDPQVVPPSVTTSWQQVTFTVAAAPGAAARMRVTVAAVATDGPWTVTGLSSNDLVVQQPVAGEVITRPVLVEGSASTASGKLVIEVRALGAARPAGSAVATVTPGSLASFAQAVDFELAQREAGAVVVYEQSPADGTPVQAVVVAIRFSP